MSWGHGQYHKDFNRWNSVKQIINRELGFPDAHPREIWWCALGVNVGAEIDGKNDGFERPAIVMRAYNRETLVVLPLTSKEKEDAFHYKVVPMAGVQWAKLTQTRVISSKRLLRKVGILDAEQFAGLRVAWKRLL